MKTGISAALIIHNDSSLLAEAIDSVKEIVDEIVVIDGAYKWVAPFCNVFNESANKSDDNLLEVLDNCGIDYQYHTGVWENETEKRRFSLSKAKNDIVLNLDSDEVFDFEVDEIGAFIDSGKAIGRFYFPLYFNENKIGVAKGLKTPPLKPVIINKSNCSIDEIVDSLFLVVPGEERSKKLNNSFFYERVLGTVHHMSNFRCDDGAYRRARFYSILSWRVTKKCLPLKLNNIVNDDELINAIRNLSGDELIALNNSFYFHRLACGFPNIKENQSVEESSNFVSTSNKNEVVNTIVSNYRNYAVNRLLAGSYNEIALMANSPLFIEITSTMLNSKIKWRFSGVSKVTYEITHEDKNISRSILSNFEAKDEETIDVNFFDLVENHKVGKLERLIVKIVPMSISRVVAMQYSIG